MLSFITDLFPAVYAEEKPEEVEEAVAPVEEEEEAAAAEPEEEEEPEDIKPEIEEGKCVPCLRSPSSRRSLPPSAATTAESFHSSPSAHLPVWSSQFMLPGSNNHGTQHGTREKPYGLVEIRNASDMSQRAS